MASIINSSMMTNLTNLVQLGQDAVKAARQAVKGLGQDSKYFASTKKGALLERCGWRAEERASRARAARACAEEGRSTSHSVPRASPL